MRSPLLLSIVVAATLGACGQSLTPNKTGSGGVGPVSMGETGGSTLGTGGGGGGVSPLPDACNALITEYQAAVSAAQSCQVGATGQCQQLVSGAIAGCSCPTYVTDDSTLAMIESVWETTGCAKLESAEPPCEILCPAALDKVCVAVDGGSTGICTYAGAPDGTGGRSGSGGTGGATDGGVSPSLCNSLVSDYAAALTAAKSCTAGAADQCAQPVPASLSVCSSCTTYVTDGSALSSIQEKWISAGCGKAIVACPAIDCISPTPSLCVLDDFGGATCSG
ncbi:MAG TPA: hypothetical protein VHG72_02535 [Polyangia bacterium]|nr:hypothetical protein [Polyangia bacterium]